ncbi:two-component system regulatory protein YycI [Macrococcoides caseolyticum]|uniref:two-component system regulatory protein YycI n=1 Tax=Macrococcoides caseolyticum TaxID=69966 RepID=UPI001F40F247|nr:two-component system regulatory protein YycI [Macrococcus caseolyticus]MCE4956670.1 two-component system regulatory protein YycI [Macrococcus caseolyticus]
MDWKHATSLFIFVFLIINIALGFIYHEKIQRANIVEDAKSERIDFKKEGIELPKLPSAKDVMMNIMSAKSAGFTETDSDFDKKSEELKTVTTNEVKSKIKLAKIEEEAIINGLKPYIDTQVDRGKEYILSGIDRKERILYFDQMYGDYPILNNDKAQLAFSYNENNEVTMYKQTYLKDIQEGLGKNNEKKKVIPAKEAIEVLYYQTELERGDTVTSVRLGYYSIVREVRGQVLKPTWQVAVLKADGTSNTFYVDALNPEQPIL